MARKEKMKVYHGLPKSITDEHTVFYADFDKNPVTPITTGITGIGWGGVLNIDSTKQFDVNLNCGEVYTIDFWVKLLNTSSQYSFPNFMELQDSSNVKVIGMFRCGVDSGYSTDTIAFEPNINQGNTKVKLANNDWYHIRICRTDKIIRLYRNGILIAEDYHYTVNNPMNNITKIVLTHPDLVISDLHISDIDRGDYFPNLPQDFIEGKATVKPRMGQQQIKGDPMYSQVTELKVPHYTGTEYDLSNQNPDNLTHKCFDHPELSTYGSDTWNAQSVIKIKGLNEEVISGVIDTDTALAKVVESSGAVNSPATIKVDDVSKFQNGDKFRVYNVTATPPTISGIDFNVYSVDASNNTLTVSWTNGQQAIFQGGVLLVETTASSSSPVVKTKEGTNVVGTWSGLGTNEAQFTLGQNHNIAGKDLYVTYALTIPGGNSDFPQLPHTVERAYDETGVEMKPVSEIVIVDDFRGKIGGSTKECPHISKWGHNSQLLNPNEFRGEVGMAGTLYNQLFNLDGRTCNVRDSINRIPQQLFSFNIIEMVERKLGCEIPSSNKASWLGDNLQEITCEVYAYGSCPSGNKVCLTPYDKQGTYNTNARTHGNATPSKLAFTDLESTLKRYRLYDDGWVHYVVYTDAPDGTTHSVIYVDYVSLQVKLKVDSTFTALYCENKRAREDKCNPVLIQKETKTVKRFIPSKESFATESLSANKQSNPSNISGDSTRTKLIEDGFIYVTSLGTGSTTSTPHKYRDCVSIIGDSFIQSITPMLINSKVSTSTLTNENIRFTRILGESANEDNRYLVPKEKFEGDIVCIKPFLLSKSNELVLTLSLRYISNGVSKYHTEREYTIPNRPLIK